MSIEDAIDLLLRQSFGFEDIHQGLKPDVASRLIDDFDDPAQVAQVRRISPARARNRRIAYCKMSRC